MIVFVMMNIRSYNIFASKQIDNSKSFQHVILFLLLRKRALFNDYRIFQRKEHPVERIRFLTSQNYKRFRE
jgi:hypothetical protein